MKGRRHTNNNNNNKKNIDIQNTFFFGAFPELNK
jgi:hypothetical protein